jgi:hypothetical protein
MEHQMNDTALTTANRDASAAVTYAEAVSIVRAVISEVAATPVVSQRPISPQELAGLRRDMGELVALGIKVHRWKTRGEGMRKVRALIDEATCGWLSAFRSPLKELPAVLYCLADRAVFKLRIELERQDAFQNRTPALQFAAERLTYAAREKGNNKA